MIQINYFYAGAILGGMTNLKNYASDSTEYLEKIMDLYQACSLIELSELDDQILSAYNMSKTVLAQDIAEINQLYSKALIDHSNQMIQIRLTT